MPIRSAHAQGEQAAKHPGLGHADAAPGNRKQDLGAQPTSSALLLHLETTAEVAMEENKQHSTHTQRGREATTPRPATTGRPFRPTPDTSLSSPAPKEARPARYKDSPGTPRAPARSGSAAGAAASAAGAILRRSGPTPFARPIRSFSSTVVGYKKQENKQQSQGGGRAGGPGDSMI